MAFNDPPSSPLQSKESSLSHSHMEEKKSPSDFINEIYGRPVIVKLYTGVIYKGMRIVIANDCEACSVVWTDF